MALRSETKTLPGAKLEMRIRVPACGKWLGSAVVGLLTTACALAEDNVLVRPLQPLRFALRSESSPDATLIGAQIDQPIRLNHLTSLVAQVYGAKGDADMGVISAGLIGRRVVSSSGAVVGLNAFYDALRDSDGFSYSRLGLGGDFNYRRLTLRANGYLPIGDSDDRRVQTRDHHYETRTGEYLTQVDQTESIITRREGARGWDAEAEWAFVETPRFFDPRLAVGYYDFSADHVSTRESGVKVRGELRAGQHVVADVEWRQDAQSTGQEWRFGVRFEFLFGGHGEPKALPKGYSKDGKAIAPQERPAETEYPRLYDPAQRLVWPEVLTGTETKYGRKRVTGQETGDPADPSAPTATAAPDCGCKSAAGPLIFK